MSYLLKIGSISLLTVLGLNLNFCNRNSDSFEDKIEAYPVQVDEGDNWSLVKKNGEMLYSDEFKQSPSAVVEGVFSVAEDKGYTLYLAEAKPKEIKGCDQLKYVGVMSGGLIPITRPDHRIEIVDKNGSTKFELAPIANHEVVTCDVMFHEDMLMIATDEHNYGYVNTSGEVVIKPTYADANAFSEGLALVAKSNSDNTEREYIVINKKGETVQKLKKSWMPLTSSFKEGYIVVRDENERILFVDKKGETIKCPAKVKYVGEYKGKFYTFTEDYEAWGVMNLETEEVVVRPKFESVSILPGNKFLGNSDGKAELLDQKGERIWSNDDYEHGMGYFAFFGLIGWDKNTYEIVGEDGKPTKVEYHQIGRPYMEYVVHSDYLDMTGINDAINKIINPKGFGKYVIGNSPQSMLSGSAEDYVYTSTYEIPDASGSGNLYRYTTKADFRYNIAYRDYYSYGYSYNSYYEWVTDNELTGFILKIDIDRKPSKDMFNKIIDTVKNAGFRLGASEFSGDTGRAVLCKGNYVVKIDSDVFYGDQQINIMTYAASDDTYFNYWVEEIER